MRLGAINANNDGIVEKYKTNKPINLLFRYLNKIEHKICKSTTSKSSNKITSGKLCVKK